MTPLRFRAWLPATEETEANMDYNPKIGEKMVIVKESFDLRTTDTVTVATVRLNDALADKSVVWMQSTGVKDKNGVEIFEGDAVTFHAFGFNGHETEYEGKGIITYRPDCMCFVIAAKECDWFVEDTSHFDEPCIEVIGNLYENPELPPPPTNDE